MVFSARVSSSVCADIGGVVTGGINVRSSFIVGKLIREKNSDS